MDDGYWLSPGSPARRNITENPAISVHTGDGHEVVIVEGVARIERVVASVQVRCDAYGPKYDYPLAVADGEVHDSGGMGSPAHRVVPHRVFGWDQDMTSPARWSFEDCECVFLAAAMPLPRRLHGPSSRAITLAGPLVTPVPILVVPSPGREPARRRTLRTTPNQGPRRAAQNGHTHENHAGHNRIPAHQACQHGTAHAEDD
ncbi:hypothetical protein [Pseudonocardia xinjiangensis]|uniref:Pyridoxamine 5'-phosphate oxidase n=1 Tax=Pseudonocardia xinjiangensis TaxID=75289 RepID=A0ABX1RBC2_9PSEU|nr:hypothetical protein [Pseudonocardia xinjiangensis]NMH76415.1 hypothetical protein [Pseudonocardia xinjiangensis]